MGDPQGQMRDKKELAPLGEVQLTADLPQTLNESRLRSERNILYLLAVGTVHCFIIW